MAIELKKLEDAVATCRQTARQLNSPLGAAGGALEFTEYVLGELRAVVRSRSEGQNADERLNALINACAA